MEAEMEDKLEDLDDVAGRERFRRYRKRRSIGSQSLSPDLQRIVSATGAFLDATPTKDATLDGFQTPSRTTKFFPDSLTPDWSAVQSRGKTEPEEEEEDWPGSAAPKSAAGVSKSADRGLAKPAASPIGLITVKQEPGEEGADSAESSFARFASIVDAALHGYISFQELLQHCESACRELAELVREEAADRHRVTEDRLMRLKGQMLHGEAASWALLWHLFGKGHEDFYSSEAIVTPATSQQGACEFLATDDTAQKCLRIVQWLEELASKELDSEKQKKGWYVGSYGQNLGIWYQTQRSIRKRAGQATLVQHLDPDAPTRENALIHPEDQKLEGGLLEDVWRLIRAGRLGEARQLCRIAGQAWRAASLGGCGDIGPSPSVESWSSQGKDRTLQALELESGYGYQRRLWKWACLCASEKIGEHSDEGRYEAAVYAAQCSNVRRMLPVCLDWESACWSLVRSWLDVQVDLELLQRSINASGDSEAAVDMETTVGPKSWPHPVLNQQPRDLIGLFQRLQTGDLVHENVHRSSREHQRLVQMSLMLGEVGHLLDALRGWVVPSREEGTLARPHGHPQMIRFAAHLVLVLRAVLPEAIREAFKEKLLLIGDLILNTYAIFLFTQQKEELVGVYAAQLAPHLCVELYVHMMDLRQNESVLVKYKIFKSAVEYLPFTAEDNASKGSVSEILQRVLGRARELKPGVRHVKAEEAGEHQRVESARKAHTVQWLCFTPPPTVRNADLLGAELLARALQYSNLLFREFALISLWRTSKLPAGAHVLLGHLAEPLKQPMDNLLSLEQHRVQNNLVEFNDWREYYACDALYRNWYKAEEASAALLPNKLSSEERDKTIGAARQALDAAFVLLKRKDVLWLADDSGAEAEAPPGAGGWLELKATAVLTSSAGICLIPDATVCTALTSALYASAGDHVVTQRELTVDVSVNSTDESYLNVALRCLPENGDGIGAPVSQDGGILARIMATAVKGELPHFQVGYALEVARIDACYVDGDVELQTPADHITRGLCRRCCIPELVLRSMQIIAFLVRAGTEAADPSKELVKLVVQEKLEYLFSKRQLQELLRFERDIWIQKLALREQDAGAS